MKDRLIETDAQGNIILKSAASYDSVNAYKDESICFNPGLSSSLRVNTTEALNNAAKANEAAQEIKKARSVFDHDFQWHDNADNLDSNLLAKSEGAYINIAQDIVKSAADQLKEQNNSKNLLKKTFTIFFVALLSLQYIVLAVLLFVRTFQNNSLLSDTVIITYISSVFLETLGAVVLMIRYAFDSAQETKVLEILKSIISTFQKFPK